jgi:hypothetical protein
MLLQQSPSQRITQFTRSILALGEGDQAVLAITAEHAIEGKPGLFDKILTPLFKLIRRYSRHADPP